MIADLLRSRWFPFFHIVVIVVLCTNTTAVAYALGKQTFLGRHGTWYAYQLNSHGMPTCYVFSKPMRPHARFMHGSTELAFVTDRPSKGERNVVNFEAGYAYKPESSLSVTIGERTFSLFTNKDNAWSSNPSEDRQLVYAMIAGKIMDVTASPADGGDVTDIYSLHGFTAAYKRITRACGFAFRD